MIMIFFSFLSCVESKMPAYKIIYFNVKALAEPMRFLLAYGNIDFEDVRIEKEDWPAIKDSKSITYWICTQKKSNLMHERTSPVNSVRNFVIN